MKHADRPMNRGAKLSSGARHERSREGPNARSLQPPRYGLGVVDASATGGGPLSIQRKATTAGPSGARPLPPGGVGKAMPGDVRARMEEALGMDFASVRVHEGPRAAALGALAYTQGTEIHFAPGQYQPYSQRGREILGHELAHLVQQAQGRVRATRQLSGMGLNDDPVLEREADELGRKALHGWGTANRTSAPTAAGPRHEGPSGLWKTNARSPSPSPAAQSMPVQRIVTPTVDPAVIAGQNANIANANVAEQLYDDALQYLWTSAEARAIYDFIHAHPMNVEIRVGTTGGSVTSWAGNGWLIEWNPHERIVAIDTDQRTLGLANANAVAVNLQPQNVLGVLSSALELLHECGHVKQHMEVLDFFNSVFNPVQGGAALPANLAQLQAAAAPHLVHIPNLNVQPDDMSHWLRLLHQEIRSCGMTVPRNLTPTTVRGNAPPGFQTGQHADIVEPDNTTRHERPVAMQKNEPLRMNYHAALLPLNLPPGLQQQVAVQAGASPVNTPMILGGNAAQPVLLTIVTHLRYLRQTLQGVVPPQRTAAKKPALLAYLDFAIGYWNNAINQHAQNVAAPPAARAMPTFQNP